MAADTMDVRNRIAGRYKETIRDNASVVISALSVLIAAGALMFSGIAMYASIDSSVDSQRQIDQLIEEVDILAMREAKIQAWLDAHGVQIE